jgi:hypothetical protein
MDVDRPQSPLSEILDEQQGDLMTMEADAFPSHRSDRSEGRLALGNEELPDAVEPWQERRSQIQFAAQASEVWLDGDEDPEEVEAQDPDEGYGPAPTDIRGSNFGPARSSFFSSRTTDRFSRLRYARRFTIFASILTIDPELDGMVVINNNGMLWCLCCSIAWVFLAAAVLLALP